MIQYPARLLGAFLHLFALLTAVALAGCASAPVHAPSVSHEVVVRKSPNDNRDYRYLVLPNALRVLLVSDPDTDKAAASLVVLRGYYQDPEKYPGLAHFLEHMLFIGTEKYPEPDGYQQFITSHGGQTNAYTTAEHTNFFFEVQPEHFREAMDRFSQFFISPLLDTAYVDREKNAVNSEYQLQIKDDGWRGNAVAKMAMNPDYEGSRFYIGSLETLGDGVADALRTFHDTEYSADQMILVALGSETLDELQAWVSPMFGEIPNHAIGPAPKPHGAFAGNTLPARLTFQSLKNSHQLSLNFPIPNVDPYYRTKPADYLSNLLGHEGEGSLHELLKSRGWIESLGAGVNRLDTANAFLTIDIALTPGGVAHIDDIIAELFGYIQILDRSNPEAWRYEEQARTRELSFEFQEQSSPTGFVYRTAPNLSVFPPEDVLIGPYLMERFDLELIDQYLSYLTPDNVLIEISGPDVDTDAVEPWFDVPYRLEQNIDDLPTPVAAGMHLPEPNPFLPEKLALLPPDKIGPFLSVDEPGRELWLDRDVEFRVPRANQFFTLGVAGGLATPRDAVLAEIYQRLVSDALNPYAYPALLAGLSYRIDTTGAGFRLSVSGYSDKQLELLDRILDEFTSVTISEDRFRLYRNEVIRDWRNFANERPYTQTYAALTYLLVSTAFDPATLADVAETVTTEDLVAWREDHLASVSVVGLTHGNVDATALDATGALLARRLPLAPFPLTEPEVTVIVEPLLLEVPVDHDDASMVLYIQDAEASYASRARSALVSQILQQSYFSSLRTEQQLGYVVSMTNRTIRDRGAIAFIIQSPVASPAALEAATIEFMRSQLPVVRNLTPEVFAQYQASLVSRLTEKAKNLSERSARYMADLDADVTTFDSQAQIAEIVASLTLEDVVAHLEQTVARLESARLLIFNRGKFDDIPRRGRMLPGPMAFKSFPRS
jgi:insulysin